MPYAIWDPDSVGTISPKSGFRVGSVAAGFGGTIDMARFVTGREALLNSPDWFLALEERAADDKVLFDRWSSTANLFRCVALDGGVLAGPGL